MGIGVQRRRRKKEEKIIFYYIIQQYKIGPRDSTAPTESQTGSRTLHNGPQYKTGATKEYSIANSASGGRGTALQTASGGRGTALQTASGGRVAGCRWTGQSKETCASSMRPASMYRFNQPQIRTKGLLCAVFYSVALLFLVFNLILFQSLK